MKSLFESIGGEQALRQAVDIFYGKVLDDTRINHFFDDADMDHVVTHQKRFLEYAFGGRPYSGRGLREAHKELVDKYGLTDKHFSAVIDNLSVTLYEMNLAPDQVVSALEIAESVREEVLGRAQ